MDSSRSKPLSYGDQDAWKAGFGVQNPTRYTIFRHNVPSSFMLNRFNVKVH
ncbi:hypothetical protein PGTUg99_006847 [Puccinia graminis f. sp. tritici]|uniref:Uncharacterized protein n=1 Tax=Puccinia graminis f. sp. tritici TaxID=56615 RepID=A0A5B0RD36_PUCGR|nr:hypothetical protein PGTUg99_006847 [Puccinia graminis f. sp. tritici]